MRNLFYFLLIGLLAFSFNACDDDPVDPDEMTMMDDDDEENMEDEPCDKDKDILIGEWYRIIEGDTIQYSEIYYLPEDLPAEYAWDAGYTQETIDTSDFCKYITESEFVVAYSWTTDTSFIGPNKRVIYEVHCFDDNEIYGNLHLTHPNFLDSITNTYPYHWVKI